MRVPRQPAYYRLTEPADEPENPWDRPKGRRGWPRWVALLVAAAVLVTAAFGWSTRRSAPPAPPPAPAGEIAGVGGGGGAGEGGAPDRGASPTEGRPSVRPPAG
ncbi:hypothetical protein [Streptomyces profundus]|uniref:hypothetical protein n=1 Tax=Streptomyces profundus TaxID=2867410 RepID=UPI001D167520|nr:hypothetical protein [Streptomyces sp. MA3_2.13]UED85996.1 hypothetical protein K4G22_18870 [Streptomyces sp. MA3_2.13]